MGTAKIGTYEELATAVADRLAQNQRVRRNLPGKGRLRIDRQLPFLCVYRSPPDHDDPGTRELVTTEAAYLFASGAPAAYPGLARLCRRIVETSIERFGAFLLLELWAMPDSPRDVGSASPNRPAFQIVTSEEAEMPSTLQSLQRHLLEITIGEHAAEVSARPADNIAPPGLKPLLSPSAGGASGACFTVGLAVRPIYRSRETGTLYPIVLQTLRRQLSVALQKAVFAFTGAKSDDSDEYYHTLGPTSLVKAARIVDQQLSEVSNGFDFLLQITPTNTAEAWKEFSASGFKAQPRFTYRPLPHYPNILKRHLFKIPIEQIEEPTLAHVFWEKQDELDRKITALRDVDTPNFLHNSLQLYGKPDTELIEISERILNELPVRRNKSTYVGVDEFAERAREEIDYYHQKMPAFIAPVEVRDDIASGIMVTQDRLLISKTVRVRSNRVDALLQHEVGTHLLTYFNGRGQRFRQLHAGLAGYEELQEGLAVLAEYLVGGLTALRLRTLAGRVMAVKSMLEGATFAQTFQMLRGHRFRKRKAFITTVRVYRAGGMTKDVIYLRGLRDLLQYLKGGHELEPLYVGKIGLHHIPYIQGMRRRGIVEAPSLLPRFWDDEKVRARLNACRNLSVLKLVET